MSDASSVVAPEAKTTSVKPARPAAPPRPLIAIGAAATVLGIAACLLVDPTFGGVLVVAGILTQAWGLHRLGRGGG